MEDFTLKCPLTAVLAAAASLAAVVPALAKPIAFADGTTVMAEYGAGTMEEVQLFYAPKRWFSAGAGHLSLDSHVEAGRTRSITYARVNVLAKRWNLPAAQGNVFGWGGLGSASSSEQRESELSWNAGAQVDYETRRIYTSLRFDLHESETFSHRIDTLQLGIAPYEHDYDDAALWFVVQARQSTGGLFDGTETAFLLRLFKGSAWIEAGVTTDGMLQAMAMYNF
jgi:hypothetical protein